MRRPLKCFGSTSRGSRKPPCWSIGDLILDHYIWGRVSRISPEAPVPVVHVDSESLRLGGAANVFNNILALGGKADLCGVIGSDESGRMFLKELGSTRSGRGGVVIDPGPPDHQKVPRHRT